jgi:hypothetical protein
LLRPYSSLALAGAGYDENFTFADEANTVER